MLMIHAKKTVEGVDGTPQSVSRWQSSAPFPTAAATAAETSFGPA